VELVPSLTYLTNAGTGRHPKPEASAAIKLANVMESTFPKEGRNVNNLKFQRSTSQHLGMLSLQMNKCFLSHVAGTIIEECKH
jgi:hypothetical protein